DFRPKSFNFLQQYRFLEIMDSALYLGQTYFLHYENEKDFVVAKMLNDFASLAKGSVNLKDQLLLEFSDVREVEYYESFGMPFFWHYQLCRGREEILRSPKLKGVVFSDTFLEDAIRLKEWASIVQTCRQNGVQVVVSGACDFRFKFSQKLYPERILGIDIIQWRCAIVMSIFISFAMG
ncbi:MAG: hypothetical protein HQK50_17285, partial [Oligoflexia bacterium]|nr:hypothetical protein [Oligoflexia bacterium]